MSLKLLLLIAICLPDDMELKCILQLIYISRQSMAQYMNIVYFKLFIES